MNLNIAIKIAIGVAGYTVWAIMAYLDATLRPDFLHFNIGMAVGTIGLVLRDMQTGSPSAPSAPSDKQSGRALIAQLAMIAVGTALLVGCASVQQAVSGYNAAAAKGLRATEDTNIEVWMFNVCATPFSAAIRHPEIIPAMKALCLPNGQASSPANLLDAVGQVTK